MRTVEWLFRKPATSLSRQEESAPPVFGWGGGRRWKRPLRFLLAFGFVALVLAAGRLYAAADPWLARVSPIMNAAERKAYLNLRDEDKDSFRQQFWLDKTITEAAYIERLAYVDSAFGSGRPGSGANTDQGRVYLANGAPNAIDKLPSSRILQPCEVWHYDSLPGAGHVGHVQFLFYRKDGIGDLKLYWPELDTIRVLLLPQESARTMFSPNDVLSENDIRQQLSVTPAEEPVIEAALGVARGVKDSGNGEILGRASSPERMLRIGEDKRKALVTSSFAVVPRPEVRVLQYGVGDVPVTDVEVRATAVASIGLTVVGHGDRLEQSAIPLDLEHAQVVLFTQRLFLLPGDYWLLVNVDGSITKQQLQVVKVAKGKVEGEGFEDSEGQLKLSITPDPHSEEAKEAVSRQIATRRSHSPSQ
jgi:GWxTD domain-containing protein